MEADKTNHFSLVILDGVNGKLIQQFQSSENAFLVMPCWMQNEEEIAVVSLSKKGKGIVKLNIDTGDWNELLTPSFNDISQLEVWKNILLFSADYWGIQNVYVLDLKTNRVRQVTSSKYGAFDVPVSTDERKIAYSDYTELGFDLVESPLDSLKWIPVSKVRDNSVKLYVAAVKQEKGVIQTDSVPIVNYEITSYNKFKHLFNFHSWAPFYYDYANLDLKNPAVYPGFSLVSKNLLGTAVSTFNYEYKNGYNNFATNYIYKAWFPVIQLSANYGGIPDVYSTRQ